VKRTIGVVIGEGRGRGGGGEGGICKDVSILDKAAFFQLNLKDPRSVLITEGSPYPLSYDENLSKRCF